MKTEAKFSYKNMPVYDDLGLHRELERLTDEIGKEYAKAFDGWLERCVKDFCSEAWEFAERGVWHEASRKLLEGDFHYRSLPGGVTEFCCGEAVLARVKFEPEFKVYHGTTEFPRQGGVEE
jgi:hypothetical protein